MTFAKADYVEVVKEIDLLFSLRSKYVVSIVDALQFDNQLWVRETWPVKMLTIHSFCYTNDHPECLHISLFTDCDGVL